MLRSRIPRLSLALLLLALAPVPRAGAQVLSQRLQPAATQNSVGLAQDLAVDGEWACATDNPERLHVYRRAGGTWSPHSILDVGTRGDSVDMDGPLLAVGSTGPIRSVSVYERVGDAWIFRQRVHAPSFSFLFGISVDVRGGEILVGAAAAGPTPVNGGRAYVLRRDAVTGAWSIAITLADPAAADNDHFGTAVQFSDDGEELWVGAPDDDNAAGVDAGAVHRFRRTGGSFTHVEELVPAGVQPGAGLGRSLASSAALFAVGALGESGPGAAYVFERAGDAWTLDEILTPPADGFGTDFGADLALEGSRLLLGCPMELDRRGAALLYQRGEAGWTIEARYGWREVQPGLLDLGAAVALEGGTVMVTAPFVDLPPSFGQVGAVYFGNYSDALRPYCYCGAGAPCGNECHSSGCKHDPGEPGGQLGAYGSTSVAADDMALRIFGLPTGANLVVFSSLATSAPAPFTDGLRCVGEGAPTFRFQALQASTTGVAELGPGVVGIAADRFAPPGQIDAGETWHFQGWYRSTSGECGTGASVTQALAVDFGP